MKIRKGFVSNSSSSSFTTQNFEELLEELKKEDGQDNMNWQNQNVFKWWVVNYPKDFDTIQNLNMEVNFNDVYNGIRLEFKTLGDIIFKENNYSDEELDDFEEKLFAGMKENNYPVEILKAGEKDNRESKMFEMAQKLYNNIKL